MGGQPFTDLLNWVRENRDSKGGMVVSTASSLPIRLPGLVVEKVIEILSHYSVDNDPVIVPTRRDLTTTQAAAILSVSRTRLLAMCNEGAIVYRRAGRDRRFKLVDVMAVKRRMDSEVELAKAEALLASTREVTGRVPKARDGGQGVGDAGVYASS